MRFLCFFGLHNWEPKFSQDMGYFTSVSQPPKQVCSRCYQVRTFDQGHFITGLRADTKQVDEALNWLLDNGWQINQVHNYCWDASKGNATWRLGDHTLILYVNMLKGEKP